MIPAITEVNFPSYATLHQATVSLQDMGDRVITTQVRIDGDIVPDFSGWELRFKGERFVLPSDNPQASKDNTTRNSIIDLQFQSWVIQELKRYYFFEAASVSAGVAIADKYIAPVRLNIEDFVALLNQVLQYYFGGKVVADLYLSGTGIYSQEPKVVDINYSYLWDVIGKIFEIYGVRNRIEYDATTDVYSIKINYPAPEISDHEFEYGYQGGLLKFERQVQDESLSNVLLGRGGEKNLPYRYFKKVDPQNPEWAADPDAIPELENIHFDRLRDINFRWYVRGWMHNPNRDTSGDEAWDPGHVFPTYEISSDSPHYWAYQKGLTDETFSPVEYVKDDDSIAAYGEHWGALDDNDDVYPTIQGRSGSGIGRIDEVVAVSPIITDDIDAMSEAASIEKSIDSLVVSVYANNRTRFEIESKQFTIPAGSVGDITYTPLSNETVFPNFVKYDTENTRLVAVPISGGAEIPATGIPAGTYRLKLYLALSVESPAPAATGDFGIENIVLKMTAQDENAWKPTFDIWVKDVWGTTRQQGETDAQYSERVWGPILGDRAGNEAKVAFSTGFMASSEDYEFVVASYPVPDTSKSINGIPSAWRITLRKSDAEFDATGLYIPNATAGGQPVAGDKFFFVGIDMPHLYVEMAEEELSTVKSGELQGTATVNPTWIISLDKVRVNTLEAGEYGQTLADRLAAGAKLRVYDPRFSGGDVLTLHAQSVTYTWNEPTDESPYIVPDIEVVLSDKVVSRESRQDKIESSVEQIKAQYARLDDVESVVRMVAEPLFLKKTGESDSSASPTQFSSKVSSKGFRQGGVGGSGWGFYKDNTDELAEGEIGDGDAVLEVDRMVVRKDLQVNSLVVNQVEYRGGMEVISAAKIEISKVIETDTRYVCYFDQRKNSVANNFLVGDIAYGQVFTPQNATLRYYKCKVEAVDIDRVELSKTVKDGSGVPHAGDILVQYGSYTNAARQYVIVRDVIGGGYERMISGLNAVDAPGAEYYFAGRQSGNGPRWFVGGHGANDDYAEFVNGVLTIKANVVFKPGQQIPGLEDYEYLKTALPLDEDATLVSGGLILSKTIALTDAQGNVKAGINGLTTLGDIAAWYGGTMVDHEAFPAASDFAKSIFRFDGSGYLAGGNIHWDNQGYGGIPGITWSRPSGAQNDVITIGANVVLESLTEQGSTVTGLVDAVRGFPSAYMNLTTAQTAAGVKTFTDGIKIGAGEPVLTWDAVNEAWHLSGNFYADGFVSSGGVSDTGGSTGIDALAVWKLLTNDNSLASYDDNTKIAVAHIPDVASTYGYATQTWVTGQINDILSSVLKFQGTTTTAISDGSTTNPVVINGASYTAQKGDVVLYNGKEYLWQGSSWEQLGDESSWALKTTTISAGTGLAGGGSLASNRTIRLSDASIASLGHADDAYSYFTDGVANSAARLSGNTAYSVWGVEFWSNGVPKSVTARPNLYVGDTKVATSAQTAMDIGGLGDLTLENAKSISFYTTQGAGHTAVSVLGFSSSNNINIGHGASANGSNTYVNGKVLYLRYGTSRTTGLKISGEQDEVGITAYLDVIPSANNSKSLGSASAMWKYTYTKRLYLATDTYIEIDASGHVHLVTPSGKGFYCDGFVSAGGLSSGGGTTGIDALAMWKLLTNDQSLSSYDDNTKIAAAHIPDMAATYGYATQSWVTSQGYLTTAVTSLGGKSGAVTLGGGLAIDSDKVLSNSGVRSVSISGESLRVNTGGTNADLTVPFATTTKKFKRYEGTDESGGYDLNTLLSGGGITSQYNSSNRWANGPSNMSFGGVVQINPAVGNTNNNLALQLAWDVIDNRTQEIYNTGKLWWRDRNSQAGWGDWRLVYDDATLTKAVVTGLIGNDTYHPYGGGSAIDFSAEDLAVAGVSTFSGNVTIAKTGGATLLMRGTALNNTPGEIIFRGGSTESNGFKISPYAVGSYGRVSLDFYTSNVSSGSSPYTPDWKRALRIAYTGSVIVGDDANAFYNTFTAYGNAVVGSSNNAGTLTVYGATTLNSTLGVIGAVTLGSSLSVAGASTLTGAVDCGNTLTMANNMAIKVKNTNSDAIEALAMSSSDILRIGYGGVLAGTTGIYGKTIRISTTDTAAGPDIYIGGLSSTHNKDAANIYFHSLLGSSAIRNGVKVAAEHVASADRLNLSVYTSNNSTSPYAPSWNKTLEVTYNGKVNVGAPSTTDATVNIAGNLWASTGIWSDGYVSAGGLSSSSDARLKKNIKDFEYSAGLLMSLKPREWDWNGKTTMKGHAAGFVAQEVEPILPYAVRERDYKQMVYDTFHAVAISGLQDHETRIQDHETRIKALEAENKQLKEEIKRLRAI